MKDRIDLMCGDCLDLMAEIPDGSVDMVMCDPPYGTTACKWDSVIPFQPMWEQLKRLVKPNGAIVMTASQPFTSALVMSNAAMFKYCWVWEKSRPTGHVHAKNKPMKKHEDVVVFSPGTTVHASQSKTRMCYNPQGLVRKKVATIRKVGGASDTVMSSRPSHRDAIQEFEGYANSVLCVASESTSLHPTQKPVALMEYLIRTYTNLGEVVLDFTMGSGTTGVAAMNTGRRFVGIEMDDAYFDIACDRIEAALAANPDLVDPAAVKQTVYPVSPRLSPEGDTYICDECGREWVGGATPDCALCSAALDRLDADPGAA